VRRYVIDLPDGERGIAVAEVLRSIARDTIRSSAMRAFMSGAESIESTRQTALSALLAGRVEEVPR